MMSVWRGGSESKYGLVRDGCISVYPEITEQDMSGGRCRLLVLSNVPITGLNGGLSGMAAQCSKPHLYLSSPIKPQPFYVSSHKTPEVLKELLNY